MGARGGEERQGGGARESGGRCWFRGRRAVALERNGAPPRAGSAGESDHDPRFSGRLAGAARGSAPHDGLVLGPDVVVHGTIADALLDASESWCPQVAQNLLQRRQGTVRVRCLYGDLERSEVRRRAPRDIAEPSLKNLATNRCIERLGVFARGRWRRKLDDQLSARGKAAPENLTIWNGSWFWWGWQFRGFPCVGRIARHTEHQHARGCEETDEHVRLTYRR